MDYEKKYNEALERAKKTIEDCGGNEGRKKMIRDIFPELKESEDEKIRKSLIHHFMNKTKPYWNELAVKDIIAWLEKQKEDQDYIRREDHERIRTDYYNRGFEDGVNSVKNEQQPAEKQDYSGLTDFERAIHRGFLCAGVENVPVTIIKETAQDCLAQMRPAKWRPYDKEVLTKIKELIDSHFSEYEQREVYKDWLDEHISQPVEWSEGDEKMLRTIISDGSRGVELDSKQISWLKSLRPQPKQDDYPSLREKEIICLKRALDYLRKEHNRYGGEDFTNEIAVLEWFITHPMLVSGTHWKPSEEQMNALFGLLEGRVLTPELSSLFNDLKKLM